VSNVTSYCIHVRLEMRVHITKADHGKPWYLRSQISHLEVHRIT